jgi:hypothetical protein
MSAAYFAEQSARLYSMSDDWRSEDPKDRFANTKNTAATHARIAAAMLRDVAKAMALDEETARGG